MITSTPNRARTINDTRLRRNALIARCPALLLP
jgi:hypothetical protein